MSEQSQSTSTSLQTAVPLIFGVLLLGGGLALTAATTSQADLAATRASTACRGMTSTDGIETIAAGDLIASVSALTVASGYSNPAVLTEDQAMVVNVWVNGVTEALNGIGRARGTGVCPS